MSLKNSYVLPQHAEGDCDLGLNLSLSPKSSHDNAFSRDAVSELHQLGTDHCDEAGSKN